MTESTEDRIPLLPDKAIEMGSINTTDTETGEIKEFFFIIEDVKFN